MLNILMYVRRINRDRGEHIQFHCVQHINSFLERVHTNLIRQIFFTSMLLEVSILHHILQYSKA